MKVLQQMTRDELVAVIQELQAIVDANDEWEANPSDYLDQLADLYDSMEAVLDEIVDESKVDPL